MRNTLTILAILFSISSNAQIVLKTNLLHPIHAGGISFALEKQTGRKSSTSFYISYGNKKNFILYDKYDFYNITLEQRFYTSKNRENMNGFFFAPYLKYMYRKYTRLDVQEIGFFTEPHDMHVSGNSLGCGMAIGYQTKIYHNWLLDLMAGLGTSLYLNDDTGNDYVGYFDMRLGLSIGYNFHPSSN